MSYKASHKPVLLKEFLEFFAPLHIKTFVDATLGAGGHSLAILEAHPEIECLIGIDGDPKALATAAITLEKFQNKLKFIQGNFRNMQSILHETKVEAMFFDIGISSMQLDESDKGFSFARNAPLDMRKDPRLDMDASFVVNTFSEKDLGNIFKDLGEERKWKQAAHAVCQARRKKKIETTFDLIAALNDVLPRYGKLHPMTLIFQSLRIFVNDELKSLEEGICQGIECLDKKGRLGVVAFHSLEDRIVKNTFRDAANQKQVILLTKKPLMASREEIRSNARSRSSRLRFVEKV